MTLAGNGQFDVPRKIAGAVTVGNFKSFKAIVCEAAGAARHHYLNTMDTAMAVRMNGPVPSDGIYSSASASNSVAPMLKLNYYSESADAGSSGHCPLKT